MGVKVVCERSSLCLFVCFCLFKLAKQKGEKEISTAELQKKKKTHTLKHVLPERKFKKKKIERVESGMDFFLGVFPPFSRGRPVNMQDNIGTWKRLGGRGGKTSNFVKDVRCSRCCSNTR